MSNTAPFEIIAQPYTAWLGAVGDTFPSIDEEPGLGWTKVGTSGDLNYAEDGVVVTHNQKVETFRALGSTGPRKAFRTEEEQHVTFSVADMSVEQYAVALDGTVATTAPGTGTAGYKSIGLSRGLGVAEHALLLRGQASSYGDGWIAQYEVPRCVQMGEQEVTHVKGAPAMLALDFMALEDTSAATEAERFGRLIVQNTDPGT